MRKIKNYFRVGNVIEIDGIKVVGRMNQNTNHLKYFYEGEYYRGVNIGEYLGIIRGPYIIVGKVVKEFLNDKFDKENSQEFKLNRFIRNIEINIIGTFINEKFIMGIKAFPLIYNEIILLSEDQIRKIIFGEDKSIHSYSLGTTVQEGIEVKLNWAKVFNTHIGIFGNTGSGKSNTLAKIFTELFDEVVDLPSSVSKFLFIDFNGEYIADEVLTTNKKVYNLSTDSSNIGDKIPIFPKVFWDVEMISILFSATDQTQKPFINAAINYYLDYGKSSEITTSKLIEFVVVGFKNVFLANNNKDSLQLLKHVYRKLNLSDLNLPWADLLWHSKYETYYKGNLYINNMSPEQIDLKAEELKKMLEAQKTKFKDINVVEQLYVILNLRLIYGLKNRINQFDYINPLLLRIESRSKNLTKVIEVVNKEFESCSVISFRNCNQDIKKILPILIAKQTYQNHKDSVKALVNKTFHMIIDEAHNILSDKSKREAESWKDYRIEVFEEIIKEGRKFGYFITLASQRPSDISSTLVSQVHNYFIHRLVNDLDLKLIDNTLTTLDNVSRKMIPNLAPGQCIITGTEFQLPLITQVHRLRMTRSPNSENIDLVELWKREGNTKQ